MVWIHGRATLLARAVVAGAVVAGAVVAGLPPVAASAATGGPAPSPTTIDTTARRPSARSLDRLAARAGAAGRVRVIVGLKARLAPEGGLGGPAASTQRATIRAQQDQLDRDLASTGARILRRFRSVPAVTAELTPTAIDALRRSNVVASVDEEIPSAPALAQSVPLVRADVAVARGFGGAGRAVAILDTGAELTHPFYADRIAEQDCFSTNSNCPNGQVTMTGAGAGAPCAFAPTQCRHGTHVTGIAAGRRTATIPFDGVAPDASIIEMQIFSRFTGTLCAGGVDPCALAWPTDQIAALERVYDLRQTFSIAAVNMSLGAGLFTDSCDISAYTAAVANLRSAGIATVIAAGNDGSANAISAPACVPGVVSVGSTTKSDVVSSFSNSSSLLSLLAPGSVITSSLPGGTTGVLSGTSMATPHVVGAFAVLRQSAPTATVDAELAALQSTGVPIFDGRNGLTKPRIDVEAARVALQPAIVPGVARVTEGNSGTVTLDVPVSLSAPSASTVSAQYRTSDATAVAPADYVAASGTVTFAPGETTKTVPVTVKGDLLDEYDEVLVVAFSGPVNGTIGGFYGLGFGVIVDDDPLPVIVPGVGSVIEGTGGTTTLAVPVTLSTPSGRTVTVSWHTVDATAVSPADYVAASGTVSFAPGQTTASVPVTIQSDAIHEATEVFLVSFGTPVNATVGGFFGLGFGVIIDDD